MADLIYRVSTPTNPTARYGSVHTQRTPRQLADTVAEETRMYRPELDGVITVYVWPARDGEYYRQPTPEDAHRYDYPTPGEATR